MMKKLLAIMTVLLFSLNCAAGTHSRTISINNNTESMIDVRDKDNHKVSVQPGRSASLGITVHEPRGSFPIPSFIKAYVTTITVEDDEGSNSIKVDENTKVVTVDEGLQLSKD